MKKQTIYLPTSNDNNLMVGSIDKNDYYKSFSKEKNVTEIESIVFTPEQYKQHLLDIQNKVLEEFKEVCICFKTPCICCDTVNSTQQSITNVFEQLIKEI